MLTVILFTSLIAVLFGYLLKKRSKLPPGPFPLPLLGNLIQLKWLAAKHGGIVGAMKELKKEYGPVFTLWMGPQPTVHVCDMDLAQETMIKRGHEFADRWVPLLFTVPRNGLGIIGTSGEIWMEQRKFALHTLKNFGLGRSLMEQRVMEEFNSRAEKFDRKNGDKMAEIDPRAFFDILVGSIINRMLFNESLNEENGAEFYRCKRELELFFERLSFVFLTIQRRFLLHVPFVNSLFRKIIDPMAGARAFLRKQVEERMKAIEKGEHHISAEPEDYVDAYLQKLQEEESVEETTFSLDQLEVNLMDLWIAGQETSVVTICSGMALLLNNLEVIDKVREELLSLTKGERQLSMGDKQNTPYFNATIMEIQRHASILNINLFRRVKEDIKVGGYPVEKGTPLTAQLSLLMSDENHFKDGHKFDPSRFLKVEKLDQQVVPFGMGKRSCLGESLARAELYLIIGNFLLRYHIEPSEELPSMEQVNSVGIMKRPNKFTMRIRKYN